MYSLHQIRTTFIHLTCHKGKYKDRLWVRPLKFILRWTLHDTMPQLCRETMQVNENARPCLISFYSSNKYCWGKIYPYMHKWHCFVLACSWEVNIFLHLDSWIYVSLWSNIRITFVFLKLNQRASCTKNSGHSCSHAWKLRIWA